MAYATVDDLAAALRVSVTPKNDALLQSCLDAAAEEIDHELDRPTDDPLPDPPPALAVRVNVDRGVELYKASDAVFGSVGYADVGVYKVPNDSFARHAATLIPLKASFGLA